MTKKQSTPQNGEIADDGPGTGTVTAAVKTHRFHGPADAVLPYARCVWTKISGVCPATGLPGTARIAGRRTVLETNK